MWSQPIQRRALQVRKRYLQKQFVRHQPLITPSTELTVNSKHKSGKAQKIGLLKNAMKRLKNSAPRMDFYKHKHGECANFDHGRCKAAGFTNINPKETACPHFKPREEKK